MDICLPKLTAYQQEVYDWLGDKLGTGKIAVIKSVRQSGKSFFAMIMLIITALKHPKTTSAIIEPTLDQCRNIFGQIVKALDNTGLIAQANASTLQITFMNSSSIIFRSTQQENSNRGYTVSGIMVFDEGAYLSDESIYTLLPVTNVFNAPIIVCSTPFIQSGYFFDMYRMGMNGVSCNIRSFDWSSHPEISKFLTEEKKQIYKQTMSKNKYTTEVLGEFLVSDGLFFNNILNCVGEPGNTEYVYIGIDFASGNGGDYTVVSAINQTGEQVFMNRTNNMQPMQQVDWIADIINNCEYPIRYIDAEKNSLGVVYIDALNKKLKIKNVKVNEWVTSNKSKNEIMNNLSIAFENQKIKVLNIPVQSNELSQYEQKINPNTKTVTYGGVNCNDDTVMALAIAYNRYCNRNNQGVYNISFLC